MKINVHAGHNKKGKIGCGAVGFLNESTEARRLKRLIRKYLKAEGHTTYDCTVNAAPSVLANLEQIVDKCNAHTVDYDISIHFNSGACDQNGNKKTTGTEVYVYSAASKAKGVAQAIVDAIAGTGLTNRGVKINPGLYVLKHTKNPALLVEVCFVDDKDDFKIYNRKKVAKAIVKAICKAGAAKERRAVKEYSLKKDGNKSVSDHFLIKEFACNDGSDNILISPDLVDLLEYIRCHFDRPVIINSAYRTAEYNKKIGGVANSQHVLGTAADIVVQGITAAAVYSYADQINPTGGVGKYATFTHVDVRDGRARWEG